MEDIHLHIVSNNQLQLDYTKEVRRIRLSDNNDKKHDKASADNKPEPRS